MRICTVFVLSVLAVLLGAGLGQAQDGELIRQGNELFRKGQYARAEPLFRRALALREAQFGRDSVELCGVLDELGTTYVWLQQFDKAEELLLRGLRLREGQLGVNHQYVALSLTRLCALYTAISQFPRAIELGERGLKILEAQEVEPRRVAPMLNRLAEAYSQSGNYGKAVPLYLRELKIQQDHGRPIDIAIVQQNLGRTYLGWGKEKEGERYYIACLNTWKTVDPPCHH